MLKLPATQDELVTAEIPAHVLLPKGMLDVSEQKFLYLLARDHYSGSGEIIDAGAFCGASGYALAAGLADNTRINQKFGRVHSYDLFSVEEPYTREYIQNVFFSRFDRSGSRIYATHKVKVGDSFLDVFQFQTQRYASSIQTHVGSITDFRWEGGLPISILFIDCAKTLDIQRHILREFFPALISGESFVIQQDFHHPWHPYIHVVMEFLGSYFDVVVPAASATRAYRLIREIPAAELRRAINFEFSNDEIVFFLQQMLSHSPDRPMLELVLARQLYLIDNDECTKFITRLLSKNQAAPVVAELRKQIDLLCPGIL